MSLGRLDALRALHEAGVSTEIRMDPLIPELTDDTNRFNATMQAAAQHKVKQGVMCYLFLRRGNMGRLATQHEDWNFRKVAASVFTQKIEHYCGNNDIRVPNSEYRQAKYAELQAIGAVYGISLGLCRCKNPDIADACCHPLPRAKSAAEQLERSGFDVIRMSTTAKPTN